MKRPISLKVQVASFPAKAEVPKDAKQKIFIPCWGEDFVHYYYLIDFESGKIITYEVDLTDHLTDFKDSIYAIHNEQSKPYNLSAEQLLFWATRPHQGEYYQGNIFVSLNSCNFLVSIDVVTSEAYLVSDPTSPARFVYSSTNQIFEGILYTCRWDIKDMYKSNPTENYHTVLEILSYDIMQDKFTLIDAIEGRDQIHTTSITRDGRYLVMIEMNVTPRETSVSINGADEEELERIMKAGLMDSKCFVYDLNQRNCNFTVIDGCPAHVEFDGNDESIMYFSQHQIGLDQGKLYSFGPASLLKLKILSDGSLVNIGVFDFNEAVRLPGHVLFDYKGQNFIVSPSTPHQVLLVNTDGMSLAKRIKLSPNIRSINFTKRPLLHVPLSLDKTPYSVQAKSDEPYLYLSNSSTIGIYNLEQEHRLFNFRYTGENVILGGGHSTRFTEIDIPVILANI
jgi:hypothetical protein